MRPGDETTSRPTTTDGNDRVVVDHTTDLTSREEEKAASTSSRHREI
jgi:hypothetical protein